MKFYISLVISKIAYICLKLLKKPATSFAGYVALKICPNFLSYVKKYIKGNFINVTGTNGKTTTSGLIAHILKCNNRKIIHNLKGANMLTGIVNTFVIKLSPFKKYDNAVIETDEAFLTKIYDFIKGDCLVVTNLFNDQLDRYGEIDFTQKIIQEAISKNSDLKLILNADDPVVSRFKTNGSTVYFGIDEIEYKTSYNVENLKEEIFKCTCGENLSYTKRFYAQQGHYFCNSCKYSRPNADYSAKVQIFDDKFKLLVTHNNETYEFEVNLVGLYNAYNALAAIATALENNLSKEQIQSALDTYKAMFGRSEFRVINGKKAIIQLIKNPAGANEVLKTINTNSHILIGINDEYADGRDMSWLWDTEFEKLQNTNYNIIVSGARAYDVATRLKYANINPEKIIIEPDITKAVKMVTDNCRDDERITILPSYTILLKISKY